MTIKTLTLEEAANLLAQIRAEITKGANCFEDLDPEVSKEMVDLVPQEIRHEGITAVQQWLEEQSS